MSVEAMPCLNDTRLATCDRRRRTRSLAPPLPRGSRAMLFQVVATYLVMCSYRAPDIGTITQKYLMEILCATLLGSSISMVPMSSLAPQRNNHYQTS